MGLFEEGRTAKASRVEMMSGGRPRFSGNSGLVISRLHQGDW